MLNIGPQELLLILVIALLVVGPHRLPELGRTIGKGLREIRKAQDEVKRTIQVNLDEPATGAASKTRSGSSAKAADAAVAGSVPATIPLAIAPDPVPLAAEPPPRSEVAEISRTLGRSLADIRRARDEVQRSFRADLGTTATPTASPGASSPAGSSADPAPAPPDQAEADPVPPTDEAPPA
jgi:sec-independent protein translocase protein TatA